VVPCRVSEPPSVDGSMFSIGMRESWRCRTHGGSVWDILHAASVVATFRGRCRGWGGHWMRALRADPGACRNIGRGLSWCTAIGVWFFDAHLSTLGEGRLCGELKPVTP
jgi:hypothetical protein